MDFVASNTLILAQSIVVSNNITLPYYSTVLNADNYFAMRLGSSVWENAERSDKVKALIGATRIIDKLGYKGQKQDSNQFLEFPRITDEQAYNKLYNQSEYISPLTNIPVSIFIAAYEIAIKLLEGVDVEVEQANLSATSQGGWTMRSTYDRSFVQAHIRAGVPSQLAWDMLQPYLIDPNQIVLYRV